MGVSDRIRQIRGELSRRSFAQRIDVIDSTLGNYEQGQSLPNVDVAARICKEFEVNPEWLLLGTGPMRAGEDSAFMQQESATSKLDVDLLRQVLSTLDDFLEENGFTLRNYEKYIIGGGIYNAIAGEKDSTRAALRTISLLKEAFVKFRPKPTTEG